MINSAYKKYFFIFLILLSISSLFVSYVIVPSYVNSQAYQYEFDQLGFNTSAKLIFPIFPGIGMLFHAGRVFLLAFFYYILNYSILDKDSIWMNTSKRKFQTSPNCNGIVIGLIYLGAFVIAYFVFRQHWYAGPKALSERWTLDSHHHDIKNNKSPQDYRTPYMYFLPYSLVTIVFLLYFPSVRLSIIAINSILYSARECKSLFRRETEFLPPESHDFKNLSQRYEDVSIDVLNSYWISALILIFFNSFLSYEYWVGRFTLTTAEPVLRMAIFAMTALSFFPLASLFLFHERAYTYTMSHTNSEQDEWKNKTSIESILSKAKVINFLLAMSLLITPVGSIIRSILK